MASTIQNGANQSIAFQTGSIPDVSGAILDYFQYMTFDQIVKTIVGFQVVETTTPVNFRGVIYPFSPRELQLLPIGERAWSWFNCYAQPVLTLQVDDVVIWNNRQTRVMSKENYHLYGYVRYTLIQDYNNSGPPTP